MKSILKAILITACMAPGVWVLLSAVWFVAMRVIEAWLRQRFGLHTHKGSHGETLLSYRNK